MAGLPSHHSIQVPFLGILTHAFSLSCFLCNRHSDNVTLRFWLAFPWRLTMLRIFFQILLGMNASWCASEILVLRKSRQKNLEFGLAWTYFKIKKKISHEAMRFQRNGEVSNNTVRKGVPHSSLTTKEIRMTQCAQAENCVEDVTP